MQHASNFQLIETINSLFLSISLEGKIPTHPLNFEAVAKTLPELFY